MTARIGKVYPPEKHFCFWRELLFKSCYADDCRSAESVVKIIFAAKTPEELSIIFALPINWNY